ncbi:MAG: hypothetical protein ACTHLW_06500 [Verrucomicrobiota bacterium]
MQFFKKNYEKVLLGLVLVGLVAVAVFLLLLVGNEKEAQAERRNKIINRPVKPLVDLDLTQAGVLLKRAEAPLVLNFSDNLHKLFNPVRWQRTVDGRLMKNPVGTSLEKLDIVKITPLYLTIGLDTVHSSESGVRYVVVIEQQAAMKPSFRMRRSNYVSKGDKKEYGENKDTFTLLDVTGPAENPTSLTLGLSDTDKPISISKENPYRRVDGYTADLRFAPENKTFLNRRVGDRIVVAGEEYNIVAITENEVVLSAKSNQKKWTITYNAAP